MRIEEYRKLPANEFIQNYDSMLLQELEEFLLANENDDDDDDDDDDNKEEFLLEDGKVLVAAEKIQPLTFEQGFICLLIGYNVRREKIFTEYLDHCQSIGKNSELVLNLNGLRKGYFLLQKLENLKDRLVFIGMKADNAIGMKADNAKVVSKSKKPTYKGNSFNASARFNIANRTVDLWNIIKNLEMPHKEKPILLACILGIDVRNARKVIAGDYPSNDDSKKIDTFINSLYQ